MNISYKKINCNQKDVICQPSRDGKITPMKIRVIDEDGEYQEYKIKGYNIIMRNNIRLNKKRILAARYAHWCPITIF